MPSKPKAHVLLLVDKSGSMGKVADAVRSGIAEYLQTLRDDEDMRYRVTLAFFSDGWELVCGNRRPKEVPVLDEDLYAVGGMTALYYAVGRMIDNFELTAAERVKEGEKVILVVQTDGLENHSHFHLDPTSPANAPVPLYTKEKVEAMVREREQRGWSVLYLGAGAAAWQEGQGFANRVETRADPSDYRATYGAVSGFTKTVSRGGDTEEAAEVMRGQVGR